MKTILIISTCSLLPSCTLISGQKSVQLDPDPETIQAVTEIIRVIQATK